MDTWNALKELCKDRLKIDPVILDYIATYPILQMCAEGRAVKTICLSQDLDEQYVRDTLVEFYAFPGFDQDLGFNARSIYERHPYNKYAFVSTAKTLDFMATEEDLVEAFRINILFDEIERKVGEYESSS